MEDLLVESESNYMIEMGIRRLGDVRAPYSVAICDRFISVRFDGYCVMVARGASFFEDCHQLLLRHEAGVSAALYYARQIAVAEHFARKVA